MKEFKEIDKDNYRDLIPEQALAYLKADIRVYWSWGVEDVKALTHKGRKIALGLKVNGFDWKGSVYIMLNFADLFDVFFVKNGEIHHELNDLYFDQLAREVDAIIENPEKNYPK